MKETGIVTKIQRYTLHDGPGIRTMVFLKGCPLRCIWCANPETHSVNAEISYVDAYCIRCGKCVVACPVSALSLCEDSVFLDRSLCKRCGACTRICSTGALTSVGVLMTTEEILDQVERDRLFFNDSGGGAVTFSGGEPLLQHRFLKQTLVACKEQGINVALETCGHSPWEIFSDILPLVDHLFFDIKQMDSLLHHRYTGIDNALILSNLQRASTLKKNYTLHVRLPWIPGFNGDVSNLDSTVRYLSSLEKVDALDVLPFHQYGRGKYHAFGYDYRLTELAPADQDEIRRAITVYEELPFPILIKGELYQVAIKGE